MENDARKGRRREILIEEQTTCVRRWGGSRLTGNPTVIRDKARSRWLLSLMALIAMCFSRHDNLRDSRPLEQGDTYSLLAR